MQNGGKVTIVRIGVTYFFLAGAYHASEYYFTIESKVTIEPKNK